ncbi:uncharacterized protein LOC143478358 [Brachyhypopomus gauderio]|uniref:uncharacterized protein LOC143478358 n=1 Tax=Brachyhypopomus gauderio TaxID=698409 RepID=UPI0040425861
MRRAFVDGRLLTVLVISCSLHVSASDCMNSVVSKRREVFLPEGHSISLVCKIQHCGQEGWRGGWYSTRKGHPTILSPSPRHHLSNRTENANSTDLLVTIQNLNQSDSGAYLCIVEWKNNITSPGHVTHVNVTTADPESGRRFSDRLLVCGAAVLCLPLALGLAYCLSCNRASAPPVPLRLRAPRGVCNCCSGQAETSSWHSAKRRTHNILHCELLISLTRRASDVHLPGRHVPRCRNLMADLTFLAQTCVFCCCL